MDWPHAPKHWLFEQGMITLGDIKRRDDYRAYEEAIAERRRDAVAEILRDSGFDELSGERLDQPQCHAARHRERDLQLRADYTER